MNKNKKLKDITRLNIPISLNSTACKVAGVSSSILDFEVADKKFSGSLMKCHNFESTMEFMCKICHVDIEKRVLMMFTDVFSFFLKHIIFVDSFILTMPHKER